MRSLTNEIERCPFEKFTISRQVVVLKMESRIRMAVACIQKIFSVPCFLMFIAHFSVCVTSLGWILVLDRSGAGGMLLLTMAIEFLNAFGGLLTCYWVAGGLPGAANAFRNAFQTKVQQRMILFRKSETLGFQKGLPELSTFTLSGCGIIYFQRKSILTLAAALLTYALVLTGWD
ncbi:hypothetical protein HNY73_013182 [Argiope bruennichi]|uniref:Uncharacterized protein n=1 Tax=Argiope bruennichi TaxID=94029 RepID=A0A8T0EX70_ARGBR|nr:hypothetical protein HNY73_013182 [Argiope bruennichi]